MQGGSSLSPRVRFCGLMRRIVFLPRRNATTHTQDMPCEITVASAAPRTPIFSANINSGSSAIFTTAPIRTVSIPAVAKPCAVMKAFSPSVSSTNTVPSA